MHDAQTNNTSKYSSNYSALYKNIHMQNSYNYGREVEVIPEDMKLERVHSNMSGQEDNDGI